MMLFLTAYAILTALVVVGRDTATGIELLTAGRYILWMLGPTGTLLVERTTTVSTVFLAQTALLVLLVRVSTRAHRKIAVCIGIVVFWIACGLLPYAAHM